jgi:hypothetical protein
MPVDTLRDEIAAARGYVRCRHVAVLSGVAPRSVYAWPAEHLTVAGTRYYKWEAVLSFLGEDAIELLGLPVDARVALQRAAELETEGKMVFAHHDFQCGDPNPKNELLHCTKPAGHDGFHHAAFADGSVSPEWGPKLSSLKRMSAAKAKKLKDQNIVHPHAVEADVPDPEHLYLPHVDARSKYMGKAVKMTPKKIEALPEYSWRLPAPTTMQGKKWRANRNIQQPNGAPEWWQGEWVVVDGEAAVRWCCVQLDMPHPEKILPAYAESDPVTEDQFIDDVKGKG